MKEKLRKNRIEDKETKDKIIDLILKNKENKRSIACLDSLIKKMEN